MAYVIGVDTGGTFTDTVVVHDAVARATGEAGTTPDDLAGGVLDSIEVPAGDLDTPTPVNRSLKAGSAEV